MNTINCSYCGYENRESDTYCVLCRHRVTPDLSGKHISTPKVQEVQASLSMPYIRVGYTCVRVMKLEINEQTGKERIVKVHEGIAVQDTGSFIRVFNPAPRDKGGDLNPETSELFPLQSRRCWCEKVSERSVIFPIPPALRF